MSFWSWNKEPVEDFTYVPIRKPHTLDDCAKAVELANKIEALRTQITRLPNYKGESVLYRKVYSYGTTWYDEACKIDTHIIVKYLEDEITKLQDELNKVLNHGV